MRAADWDARYAASESVWGADPNRFVAEAVAGLTPGRAVDLACGEGRNAVWLARRGWRVTAVDFSAVAVERGRSGAGSLDVEWVVEDIVGWRSDPRYDLVLVAYLHLPAAQRATVVAAAAAALAPGGTFLLVAHDRSNLADGVGGPQDAAVLPDAADVVAALGDGVVVERAEVVLRPVEGAPRPARDLLVQAHRPA